MDEILQFIQSNVEYAPYLTGSLLLLAGFNLPVSEDLMIFISAMLAKQNPDHKIALFIGVFCGAYFSDLISYWLGRLLGPKLWKIKFWSKMVSMEKVGKITNFYQKYGPLTLILGRFIPFGVRNGLFLTAGLGKMSFPKFAASDFVACILTNTVSFVLIYTYGEAILETLKKGNIVIFSVFLSLILITLIRKRKQPK